jgi:hypothetical protein
MTVTHRSLRTRLRHLKSRFKRRHLRTRRHDGVHLDVGGMPYMGFGATVAWLQMAVVAADALGVPLTVQRPQQWPFGGRRAECALDRFLELPVAAPAARSVAFDPGSRENLARWGYYDELDWDGCLFGYRPQAGAGLEDYRRAVLARAYRPTSFAREAIAVQARFLPARYVAWHVRRGDKTAGPAKEDEAVPLERYVEATRELLRAGPATHLVICTDAADVVTQARALASTLGLTLAIDPDEKRWDGYCAIHRAGGITDVADMVAEVLTAQKNLEILRHADALVGCNSSYLFRVAALLQQPARAISLSENKRFRRYYPL